MFDGFDNLKARIDTAYEEIISEVRAAPDKGQLITQYTDLVTSLIDESVLDPDKDAFKQLMRLLAGYTLYVPQMMFVKSFYLLALMNLSYELGRRSAQEVPDVFSQ